MTFARGAQALGYLCSAKEDEGYMSTTRQSSEEMLQALRSQVNAEPHKTGQARAPWTIEDSEELYRIHGWGDDYDESRYNGIVWPLVVAAVCVAVFFWGLQPWS